MNVPYIVFGVAFHSRLSLENVAARVSAGLFGGLSFGGRDEYIRDEIPALYLSQSVMGLKVVLQGEGGADGYFLEGAPVNFPHRSSDSACNQDGGFYRGDEVSLSHWVAYMLEQIDELYDIEVE